MQIFFFSLDFHFGDRSTYILEFFSSNVVGVGFIDFEPIFSRVKIAELEGENLATTEMVGNVNFVTV